MECIPLLRVSLISAFFLLISSGCTTKLTVADSAIEQEWLSFIKDGNTTKKEVLLKLGIPSAQFEGEHILTYRMTFIENIGFQVMTRRLDVADPRFIGLSSEYNLVLVFGEDHILKEHSLIRINPYP